MPSKDSLFYIPPDTVPSTNTQRDLDDLVHQIHELKVKGLAPSSNTINNFSKEKKKCRLRASPYARSDPLRKHRQQCDSFRPATNQDPFQEYEALQVYIRDGDLIKEAVRRLKIINDSAARRQKQIFSYESDDERGPYPFKVEL